MRRITIVRQTITGTVMESRDGSFRTVLYVGLAVVVFTVLAAGAAAGVSVATWESGASVSVEDEATLSDTSEPPVVADTEASADDERERHEIEGYSVVQGDRCIPVQPIGDGNQTVEEFYDYRNPATDPESYTYSSHGTTHLQEDDTSIVFLYEGSDGLSLVLVHDQYDGNTSGGALTAQIDNLPEEGEWVVEDDNYSSYLDTRQLEEWEHGDNWSRITHVWSDERTDGAAFNGGLNEGFAIEIDIAFNDDADFRVYDGEITDWEVVSAPEDDPGRTSLDMDEPIVIRSESCITISDLSVDDDVTVGDRVEVVATATNEGETEDTATVPVVVDGEVIEERIVTIDPGESTTMSTVAPFDEEGTSTVSVGNETVSVTVSDDDPGSENRSDENGTGSESGSGDGSSVDRVPGFGLLAGTLVTLAVLFALAVRRR